MELRSAAYLHDIRQAAERIAGFIQGKSFGDYTGDILLRSAVERQLEIAGEALSQLAKSDSAIAGRISEHWRVIALRNILIHGYAKVDDRVIWSIVERKLPTLRREVTELLRGGVGAPPGDG